MTVFEEITEVAEAANLIVHKGYAPTWAGLPYTVHRPLTLDPEALAISGNALGWNSQTVLYACAESVEASFNLALELMRALQGARVANTTLSTSMGYVGAMVEGHYESSVTVQLNQGGI